MVLRRQIKRRYVLAFFQKLPPCLVGIEACASAHHWSRQLQALGLPQVGAGRFLGVDPRTCRRYVADELPLPPAAAMLLRVMLAHGLAPDDVSKLDGRPNRSRD